MDFSIPKTLKETYYGYFQVHTFTLDYYWNLFICSNVNKNHPLALDALF